MTNYYDMHVYMQLQVPRTLKEELMPPTSVKELKQFFLIRLPILGWLRSYQLRFLIGDITAGLTVSIMHILHGECMHMVSSVASYIAMFQYTINA